MKTETTRFSLNLGATVQDQQNYLNGLKHAMCAAMMLQVQTDTVNESFAYLQTIYLEAHHLQTR